MFSYIQTKKKKKISFFSCLIYLCLCIYSFVDVLHYIHLQERQLMYFYAFVIQKKKMTCGNMGKNIKSYATIPTLHSLAKGGKPYGKKSLSIGQTKHDSVWSYTFFDSPSPKTTRKNSKFLFDFNLQRITQILCNPLQNSSTLASLLSDR